MTRRSDPNPAYWEQYGPFQHVKHELIRCYLNGWFPKLGTWAGRVEVVRDLKRDGIITADAVPGRRFGAAANPLLRLAQSGGGTPRN